MSRLDLTRSQSNSILKRPKTGLLYIRKPTVTWLRSPDSDVATVDLEAAAKYFLSFWDHPQIGLAMKALERYESKRMLKPLRQKYGQWCPPPELAQVLKPNKGSSHGGSELPNTREARNLKFVLEMLGCTLHQNRPFKEFVKAKSVRQKRLWVYKYMKPQEGYQRINDYAEPICPLRLKRLYRFFPDRFTEQDNSVYFNDKLITYDEKKNLYFLGVEPTRLSSESE